LQLYGYGEKIIPIPRSELKLHKELKKGVIIPK
jgi:hypothetical protein